MNGGTELRQWQGRSHGGQRSTLDSRLLLQREGVAGLMRLDEAR
jgi:hypothetical protein